MKHHKTYAKIVLGFVSLLLISSCATQESGVQQDVYLFDEWEDYDLRIDGSGSHPHHFKHRRDDGRGSKRGPGRRQGGSAPQSGSRSRGQRRGSGRGKRGYGHLQDGSGPRSPANTTESKV